MLHVLIDLQLLHYFCRIESFGTKARQHRAVDVGRERQDDSAFLDFAVDNHLGSDGGWEADCQCHCGMSVCGGRLAVDNKVDSALLASPVGPPDANFMTQNDNVAFVGVVSLK